jgi:large subunit ribosomal protein L25
MEKVILEAQARPTGKKALKNLRKNNSVPCIYYTGRREVRHIAVDAHDLSRKLAEDVAMLHLQVDGDELPCIIREVQRDPASEKVLHVDFFAIEQGHKLRVTVNIQLSGTPEGVKQGGILEHAIREVRIECLPKDLPSHLEIDISHLQIGDSIHIENLSFENVTLLEDPHTLIAHVIPPRLEKEVEEVKEEEAEEAEEPEVITERRGEDDEKQESKEK